MRHRVRHLPAYLGLLLPLAAMAWLGSAELGRQTERAEKAMFGQAASFLGDAVVRLDRGLHARAVGIEQEFEIDPSPLVELDRMNGRRLPFGLGLVLLEADGDLVYPVPPDAARVQRILGQRGVAAEVRTAEQLIDIGDLAGARAMLEDYLERPAERVRRGPRLRPSRGRALFRLASILRRLDEPDAAEAQLRKVRGPWPNEPLIELLSDVSLAEIEVERDDGFAPLLSVMERIASGEHYIDVGDDVLAATLAWLDVQRTDESDALGDAAEAAKHLDSVRRAGRDFAREYRDFERENVRRQLRAIDETGVRFVCHGSGAGAELLVLRELSAEERARSPALLESARWIGIRCDLPALIEDSIGEFTDATSGEFFVTVDTLDGSRIAPTPSVSDATPGFEAPNRRAIGGLTLQAHPSDSAGYLAARRASSRNSALLLIALCVTAGVGAFLLLRSTHRESEIAELKMKLVSRVSHELKTPLALIKMYSETLAQGRATTPEQANKFTGIITRQTDRLAAMVERVLDLSRREAAVGPPPKRLTDLSQLTRDVVEAYRPRAEASGVPLELDVEPDVHAEVDPSAFESALLNLVDNALKYSPPTAGSDGTTAGIEVELRARGDSIELEVRDRGIGIPEHELEHVFTTFFRASNAAEAPGAGLGLSLVRGFTDAHGGKIYARRRDGGGTVFHLHLKRAENPESRDG
ncbi:MAG: HAMP domain-containing histidine kinase [Planctomycetes bacterium]|nr:HAMP domain-containing histidine kinase [Planctomycetota bacterium]